MDAILDFLKNFADVIADWYDSFILKITAESTVMELILKFRESLPEYLAWIPDQVYQIIFVGFSICVLFILIGRC